MTSKYHGSCLCGVVCYEIEGDFEHFYLCHCSYCRKDTGSAHAANLISSSASLRWLAGEKNVTRYDLPSTRHSKSFCSVCGSALPCLQMNNEILVVPAGSVDTELTRKPDAHIFVASRANWDRDLEQVSQVERFPV